MFVNNILFLINMSCSIRFVVVEHVPTCTDKQRSESIKIFISLYSRGHMVVKNILMDMEFDKTIDELMD